MNTLFTNANILTPQGVVRGCLGVADDRIAFVGELPQDFLVERSIDCEGGLLLPGLVNAHTHLSMTLFRNAADDMELSAWLQDRIWPLEDQLDAEACYYGALLALAEGIRGGTTAFNDMYFFEESVARAVAESGVRRSLPARSSQEPTAARAAWRKPGSFIWITTAQKTTASTWPLPPTPSTPAARKL